MTIQLFSKFLHFVQVTFLLITYYNQIIFLLLMYTNVVEGMMVLNKVH